MKQFSEQEKQLIYSIYQSKDSNNYVLANVFNKWIYGDNAVGFDFSKSVMLFDFSKNPTVDTTLDTQKDIISSALLIKYLEDNGYIYFIEDNATINKPTTLGPTFKVPLSVKLPSDVNDIISRTTCRVYVSYALIQLVENDFMTYEELQLQSANNQLKAATCQLNEAKSQSHTAKITMWLTAGTCFLAICTFIAQLLFSIYG